MAYTNRIESVVELSARLVEKNKAFTSALKKKKPNEDLKVLHAEIQEIYNQITSLKYVTDFSY
jgi:hypothetical protein